MQSSYSVLKRDNVNSAGEAVIDTKLVISREKDSEIKLRSEKHAKEIIKENNEFNSVGYSSSLIEDANREALRIKNKAYNDAVELEQKAFEEGFSKGQSEGYNSGYESGRESAMEDIYTKEKELLSQAYSILEECRVFKERYLKECESNIKEIISETVKSILRKSVVLDNVMDGILKEHLSDLKKEEQVTLYVNSHYYDHIQCNNKQWLEDMNSSTNLKVIADDSLLLGKMIIEKSDGKVNVDITGLDDQINDAVYSE